VIGAFQQRYVLPPQIRWTNRESLAMINRSADVPLIWNPEGYSADDVVTAFFSAGPTALSCTAPATAGQLTMPAALLQQMPSSADLQDGYLGLTVVPKSPTILGLPVIGSLDAPLLFEYSFGDSRTVAVR
jgi:hypothetical protein